MRTSVEALAISGIIGFAWLDDALVAFERFGTLADWIPIGEKITESVPYFLGLGTELLDLQDEPGSAFVLSNVGIPRPDAETLKVSFEVFWSEAEEQYCLIVHRLGARSAAEYELIKQVRARRIAEENLRNAEELLQEKQELLGLLAADAPVALAMFDRDLRYLFASQRWSELFGNAFEPLIGRSLGETAAGPDGNADQNQDQKQSRIDADALAYCLAGGKVTTPINEIINRDGKAVQVRLQHAPWYRGNGVAGGVISVAEVVSEAVAAQTLLESRNRQLAGSNQRLEQFASIAAHDLKAPLRNIRQVLAQMRKTAPDMGDGSAPGMANIERQIDRMQQMLGGLMAYVTSAGSGQSNHGDDLPALLGQILVSLTGTAAFDIRVQPGSVLPANSPLPVDIVLRNLIQNAVVHHDHTSGEVVVSSSLIEGRHELTVSDDGPGIPVELQSRIFEPFWQADAGSNGNGSGLGLALVQQIVDLHHGAIKVISPSLDNRGTRFEISVPLLTSD